MQSLVYKFIGRAVKKNRRPLTNINGNMYIAITELLILKLILNWGVGRGVFEE